MARLPKYGAGTKDRTLRSSYCRFAAAARLLRRALSPSLASCLSILLTASLISSTARAGVGVVLNDSLDTSIERITGSGHTAVYFSHICADSPVKLRLCRPGEEGSVMSNYINIGEDKPFEWNIVPLSIYVNGVEDPRNRPLIGTGKIKAALEDRYRDLYLGALCTSNACRTSGDSEWREMVGAGLSRNMYIFTVETSRRQDLEIIAKYNSDPNVNHFNGAIRNCADFTKDAVNSYFPHSAHRDVINDFGMTSPKAVARTFTDFALHHPEMRLRVLHFSQVPGTIKRSTQPRNGTEQLYQSKKLLIPMLVFADYAIPVVAGAYFLTGRFNSQHQFEAHSAESTVAFTSDKILAGFDETPAPHSQTSETLEIRDRDDIVGTKREWKHYQKQLSAMLDEAVRQELFPDRDYWKRFLKTLGEIGQPIVSSDGAVWLEVPAPIGPARVGVSPSNILASDSDPLLAYEILLARAQSELHSPMHSRETMLEFEQDWMLLQAAHDRVESSLAGNFPSPSAFSRPASTPSNFNN